MRKEVLDSVKHSEGAENGVRRSLMLAKNETKMRVYEWSQPQEQTSHLPEKAWRSRLSKVQTRENPPV